MTPAMRAVHRLLIHNLIPHDVPPVPPGSSFREQIIARFPGEEGEIPVQITAGSDGVFFTTPIRSLTEEQLEAARALADGLHRSVRTGLFTVSLSDESFSFSAYCLPSDRPPSTEELASLLVAGPMMAQLYGPALDLVLEGVPAEDAIEAAGEIEGKPVMSLILPDPRMDLTDEHDDPLLAAPSPVIVTRGEPDDEDDDEDDEDDFFDDYPPGFEEMDIGPLTGQIREYYRSQHWRYQFDPTDIVFRMRIASRCVDSFQVITFVRDEEWFTTLTVFPIRVPEDKRELIEELIARANYGMILGCFELDKRGLLQFRNTCLCGELELSQAVIERHIDVGFRMCDRYGPAILKVIYGGASPADAVLDVEKDIRIKHGLPVEGPFPETVPEVVLDEEPEASPAGEIPPAKKGFVRRFLERIGVIRPEKGGEEDA